MKKIYALFVFSVFSQYAYSQINPPLGIVYNDSVIPKIYININPDSLAFLISNQNSDIEFHATFIYKSVLLTDTVNNVAFSLRGNTSLQAQKKSFKISFNTYNSGRDFYGIEKMNLNGEHNDPSIVRSKLCWDLLKDFQLPSARANHVELYLNNSYYGLYMNVEQIDEKFLKKRFGNNNGNLFKCLYPADLAYLGSNPDLYKLTFSGYRIYDLKTNQSADNYSDLAKFISTINNVSTSNLHLHLDSFFNTNNYIKTLCVDILTANWDGYAYNKNNFYLYHNSKTDKFEYIPYDLDNTFGIDWFNINWTSRNIYNWYKTSENRPLASKILQNSEYRKRFTFYMRQLLLNYFNAAKMNPRIDYLKNFIQSSAFGDPFRPLDYNWSITDFVNSYLYSLGAHVKFGLKPYISQRYTNALNQLENTDTKPIITNVKNNEPRVNQDIIIQAKIEDETLNPLVNIKYQINNGNIVTLDLFDDGLHNDFFAGDKIYGNSITSITDTATVFYQIYATDSLNQTSIFPLSGYLKLKVWGGKDSLIINEFMAGNSSFYYDNFGEYEDWIEIMNYGNTDIFLGDKYLSDDFSEPTKWKMPDTVLYPNQFIVFFADNSVPQGLLHTNFKLNASGEQIGIFDNFQKNNLPIDTITFFSQNTNISFGRYPDAASNWFVMNYPTPINSNVLTGINKHYNTNNLIVYPNPATTHFTIITPASELKFDNLYIYNIYGQIVDVVTNINSNEYYHSFYQKNYPEGLYILKTEIIQESKKTEYIIKLIIN